MASDLSGCVKAISDAGNNMKLEKIDERKGYVLTTIKPAEKEDWNVTSQISSNQSLLIKYLR